LRGRLDSLGAVSRLAVPRMIAAGSLVSAATGFRVAVGCLELLAQRTPPLIGLAVGASVRAEPTAEASFRDDVIALARDSAELSWRELRRGVDELDAMSRPSDEQYASPHRPYRVKL
jgi:hypothetical protein